MIQLLMAISIVSIFAPFITWFLINWNSNNLGRDFPKWKTIGYVFLVSMITLTICVISISLIA